MLELLEHIDVAVFPEVATTYGPEKRKLADVISPAELLDAGSRNLNPRHRSRLSLSVPRTAALGLVSRSR
jgi:hypothetical protein